MGIVEFLLHLNTHIQLLGLSFFLSFISEEKEKKNMADGGEDSFLPVATPLSRVQSCEGITSLRGIAHFLPGVGGSQRGNRRVD